MLFGIAEKSKQSAQGRLLPLLRESATNNMALLILDRLFRAKCQAF